MVVPTLWILRHRLILTLFGGIRVSTFQLVSRLLRGEHPLDPCRKRCVVAERSRSMRIMRQALARPIHRIEVDGAV